MKVIETSYRGIKFRSRLEARWAVFYSMLNIPFQYEPEGFELGPERVWYLPDFYLPKQDCYVEIKPGLVDYHSAVCKKCQWLSEVTGKRVFLFFGGISVPNGSYLCCDNAYAWYPCWDYHHLWCECPNCRQFDVQFEGRSHRIRICDCVWDDDKGRNFDSDRLVEAYESALSERFGVHEGVV